MDLSKWLNPDDMHKPVKVSVSYEDGNYWLEAYTDEHAAAGLPYVEVDTHTWAQWEAYRAQSRAWHAFCAALERQLCEKD